MFYEVLKGLKGFKNILKGSFKRFYKVLKSSFKRFKKVLNGRFKRFLKVLKGFKWCEKVLKSFGFGISF